ncbi:Cyanovirin-N [Mycena maculata]|uniref:Cyanovirin-N n=1 Tax=Mycena maculata TaxID=230809 RepID=A0AAD7INJ5_9AGAR|nr:Cyanovirin-N [Mycena maculata]
MKTTVTLAAVVVALFVPSEVRAQSDSGFSSTCATWSGSGTILTATCTSISGSMINSTLDLNDCFANTEGILGYQVNGNFAGSCSNITHNSGNDLDGDTGYLSAICSAANGDKFDTAIATSNYVGNENGVLQC